MLRIDNLIFFTYEFKNKYSVLSPNRVLLNDQRRILLSLPSAFIAFTSCRLVFCCKKDHATLQEANAASENEQAGLQEQNQTGKYHPAAAVNPFFPPGVPLHDCRSSSGKNFIHISMDVLLCSVFSFHLPSPISIFRSCLPFPNGSSKFSDRDLPEMSSLDSSAQLLDGAGATELFEDLKVKASEFENLYQSEINEAGVKDLPAIVRNSTGYHLPSELSAHLR